MRTEKIFPYLIIRFIYVVLIERIIADSSSLGYTFISNVGLFFDSGATNCMGPVWKDNRTWTMYTEEGLLSNITLPTADGEPSSLSVLQFTDEG